MSLESLLPARLLHQTGLLLLAVVLGGLVGWERERHERPAGLRTHILVCLGATLITLVSNSSPSVGGRIAAQIVTGVGFLGAGTILRDNSGMVRGLTTAASLWAIAGVGIAIGYGGLYAQTATVATLIILFTLTLLNSFEDALNRHRRRHKLMLLLACDGDALAAVSRLLAHLREQAVETRDLRMEKIADGEILHLEVNLPRDAQQSTLEPFLAAEKEIIHYEWED